MKQIYFDNSTTSFPKAPKLSERIADFINNSCVNINRGNYNSAYDNEIIVMNTRKLIADFFDCEKDGRDYIKRVIFTSGITFSINCFLNGFLKIGDHIIVGAFEHHCVMRPLEHLKGLGVEYSIAKGDKFGNIDIAEFEKRIKTNTKAILVNHASNVCGTLLDIEKIGQLAKEHNLFFAVDTAQSAGSVSISMQKANIDFLAFAGHKGLLGMQGIGGFIISKRLEKLLPPFVFGGTGSISSSFSQPMCLPDKYESGTLNLPGIVGLNHCLSFINKVGIDEIHKKEMALTDRFLSQINEIDRIEIIGKNNTENRVSVVSLNFKGLDNSLVAMRLESEYGIMTRVGLHCAALAHKSLGTLETGTVRFSFGYFNTFDEIDYSVQAIKNILKA